MKVRHLPVMCVSLLFLASSARGGVLFGTVRDEHGNPVAGATVRVYGKELSTKTDSQGRFRIESKELLDGNMYSVTVSAEGFDDGQTIGTEMFDDPEEMEPLEIVLYKTEPLPEPSTNLPPEQVEGLGDDRGGAVGATNNVLAIEEPLIDEQILDEGTSATNAPARPAGR